MAATAAKAMEKYTSIAPVVVEDLPDAHNVFLHATNQRFCVTAFACETKEEAEWTREMLCIALAKIVNENSCENAQSVAQGSVPS